MDQQPFLAAFTGLLLAGALHAAEWPQYRGPNFDGSTAETIRTNWTEKPLEVVWKRSLQPGWSSPMVAGGRLITQVRGLDQGRADSSVGREEGLGSEWVKNEWTLAERCGKG